ncbi:MAG: homoserine O-acetyltransferase [Actinobacteria bacterium]|nr:homoserine O-acetyltransferase [Actinomycetota bacterium]
MTLAKSVTGAWLETHPAEQRKFVQIGDVVLESGEVIPEVVIAYQTFGELNSKRSNAVFINHAMTGWSDAPAWWPGLIGPGKAFDTEKYFVVCANVIGGCQGSTGPSTVAPDGKRWGSRFPTVTIRDMVQAEFKFSDAIGIDKYLITTGPSLGGMRALEWAVSYSDRVGAICTIGSSAVASGDQIGTHSIQIQAIKSDPNFNNGDYFDQTQGPVAGMAIARQIAHLTYRTEYEMAVRFGSKLQDDGTGRFAVVSYLNHQAEKLQNRFDANTYIKFTEAMNSHDIGRDRGGIEKALSQIEIPVVVASIDTDRLFPPRLQQEIVDLTPTAQPLEMITSPYGHDGFLIETQAVGEIIKKTLALVN